MLTVLGVVE